MSISEFPKPVQNGSDEHRVVWRELPEASQNVRMWEMTEAQYELTELSSFLRPYGIEIRYENDVLSERAIGLLNRINGLIFIMDQNAVQSGFAKDRTRRQSDKEH